MGVVRRLVPLSLLPLTMLACGLASAPWLRAFPSSVLALPLFGAAILSVLVPVVVNGIGVRRLGLTIVIDAALLFFYELFVTLRDPGGITDLYNGLVHGPAQLLSFALPLVSPRTLLVAPIALCWLSGAVLGECVARGWRSLVPYLGLVLTLGLSYGATTRAITTSASGRRSDTIIAGALLLTMLLMRVVSGWIDQDARATAGSAESILPIRGLGVGTVVALAVAALAAVVVQAPTFSGPPQGAARRPPVNRAALLTPLSFIAGVRPQSANSRGHTVFRMTTDRASSNYVGVASVDTYDGDGWTFDRTFRPSGGVLPADTDPTLRPAGPQVDQEYRIAAGLRNSSWLPALYRAKQVTGAGVDVDPASGMIVPDSPLSAGETYSVSSTDDTASFAGLRASARIGGYAQQNLALPPNPDLQSALTTLVTTLEAETGTQRAPQIPFLQAVARDFQTRSALASTVPLSASGSASASASASASGSPAPATSSQVGAPAAQHAGGTSFADVLASIRQFRSATPEQFATLMCLVARAIGVPARIATGFRIPLPRGAAELPAGTYRVTSAQAWTWVEIPIQGMGWVVLDPSPSTHGAQRPQSSSAVAPTPSNSPTPSRSALITRGNNDSGHAVAPHSRVPHRAAVSAHSLIAVLVVVAGVLLLLAIVLLLTRKQVRRRRRHGAPDPRRRLLGAWQESLDLLEEAGLPDLTHASSRDITRVTDERFGPQPAEQVRYLGEVANRAIFSPSRPVAVEDAEDAWRAQHVLRRAVRERLGWRSRLRTDLRYHRRRPAAVRRGPMRGRARH